MTPEELMALAIDICRQGIGKGQTPFGCAIALNGELIAVAHNTVWESIDITAHAEVNALREAGKIVRSPYLEGAIVATTCEPCPMCTAALCWARVEKVYFGATTADATLAGFSELNFPTYQLPEAGEGSPTLVPNLMRNECLELFAHWNGLQ
ncbi:nucleoside deaminase [Bremerella cremea]|uniref:Nucleoside deaminase n=1 Tax=Bremerella cremea TaxID=1031537 RepID=A0A368KTB3_9BACT|nr:nucleoside deaminase [Bremerella cremea]RCS49350.1 nucleoside deaminase [Bremerella cremea]